MRYWNGNLITTTERSPTSSDANGIFDLTSQRVYKQNLNWPGIGAVVTQGLLIHLDAGNLSSYPGSGSTWTDLSSNGHHGTIQNGAVYVSSSPQNLDFDGNNDYVNFTSGGQILTSSATEISCFLWLYPVSDGVVFSVLGGSSLSSSYHHSSIEINSSGQVSMALWHNSLNSKVVSQVTLNTWNNIGFTHDGTTFTGYVNGSAVGNNTYAWAKPSNIYFALMAGDSTNMGTGSYGDGNLSVFLAYDRALTATEVASNFNSTRSKFGV